MLMTIIKQFMYNDWLIIVFAFKAHGAWLISRLYMHKHVNMLNGHGKLVMVATWDENSSSQDENSRTIVLTPSTWFNICIHKSTNIMCVCACVKDFSIRFYTLSSSLVDSSISAIFYPPITSIVLPPFKMHLELDFFLFLHHFGRIIDLVGKIFRLVEVCKSGEVGKLVLGKLKLWRGCSQYCSSICCSLR